MSASSYGLGERDAGKSGVEVVPPKGPILVTGMPRAGTTWLARLLATAPGTALPGREPMNPRGRQYALGSTVPGWVCLDTLTGPQLRRLSAAYAGWNPRVFSRYGRHQWAAPLPWVRVVIKDPFALLSVPAVARATGASTVVVFRHPGAALTSYRRMGWSPDLDELDPLLESHRRARGPLSTEPLSPQTRDDPVAAMAWFWSALHEIALDSTASAEARVQLVSHEELAGGGEAAARRLFDVLGLRSGTGTVAELSRTSSSLRPTDESSLHRFDRAPTVAASQWRGELTVDELSRIESLTAPLRERLDRLRLRLAP